MSLSVRGLCALLAAGMLAGCAAEDAAAPVAAINVDVRQAQAAIGGAVDFTYRFAVQPDAPSFTDDYMVFVHFVDEDGEQLWTDDHEPPTPIRSWKPGATIEYERIVFVPRTGHSGETRVVAGIYAPRTGERLPLAGDQAGPRAYQVATLTLQPGADDHAVAMTSGWYNVEGGDDGIAWQWSQQEAGLAFRNPKRAADLLLQMDQPVSALPGAQQIELRIGSAVVDAFALASGRPELRRIALTPAQMGTGETVEMTLTVDETFVPAELPRAASSDRRRLGVRVFRAVIQPK